MSEMHEPDRMVRGNDSVIWSKKQSCVNRLAGATVAWQQLLLCFLCASVRVHYNLGNVAGDPHASREAGRINPDEID